MHTDTLPSSLFSPHLLSLLHLADSAFPVGGFTYSYGLESAIRHGLLAQPESVSEYLHTYAEQVISFDFPFVSSAYLSEKNEITDLFACYETMLLNPWVRKASTVVGKNWWKICTKIYRLEALEERALQEKWSYDFPVVFGASTREMGIPYQESLFLYFYMTIRDQISALIRLGAAGPSWAHAELNKLLASFQENIACYTPIPWEEAYKSAYLQELAQLSHGRVYSKLFQN